MRRLFLATICALLFSATSSLAQTKDSVQTKDLDSQYAINLLKPGVKAPDFKLRTYDGKDIMLNQFRGNYLVLDFWASWCPDCRRDIPEMKALFERFRDKGVQFLGVSFDTDKEAWLQTYWTRYQMPWPQVSELKKFRKETMMDKLYKIDWIPTMYLIAPDGKILLGTVEINKLRSALEHIDFSADVDEQMTPATFPGGEEGIARYFSDHQRASISAIKGKVYAEMTVVFNVEIDGTVTGARVLSVDKIMGTSKRFMKMKPEKQQNLLSECTEFYKAQAVRLTNSMPQWSPATIHGKPIQTTMNTTIIFMPS